ncbi:hypothetical protein PS938_04340 [Pseudomonas fluorescens]|uniref:Uncharacterized protein n=1 Tax=Pseudomonas fluorescens TaxID=294 RepID=A0A5E7UZ30_PSEFL|nr:hypothetical protein PS938_04340 [Pseudomonas fluorescens]
MLVVRGGGARAGRLVSSSENALDSVGWFGFLTEYISISSVTAAGGFALTASPFWQTPQKEPKGLAPYVRPLAEARGSFAPAFIRGHRPPVGFAGTYMRCVRLRRTALRAHPRMNTSTQPADGAGGSRSRAAGELTLGLMSGEEQRVYAAFAFAFLWEPACWRWRPASRPISCRCPRSLVGASLLAMGLCRTLKSPGNKKPG